MSFKSIINNMINEFKGKVILVTGGAGSIGSALVKELLKYEPKAVRVLDLHEHSLHKLEQSLNPEEAKKARFLLGDVRDKSRLIRAMHEVDIVYHAAAYKHVHLCEYNPLEAIRTNVIGTQNAIDACLENKVQKFIFISTDKAVNPTGTLGASKLLGEKITTAANYNKGNIPTMFSSVRFGNVTMSNGSVIPKFIKQIHNGGEVTVTSPKMTRFLMPLSQAVGLIFKATQIMKGSEIFVLKMKSLSLKDLALSLIQEYRFRRNDNSKKIKIINIGRRAGEKMHEQLISEEEGLRISELDDMLIVMPSAESPYDTGVDLSVYKQKKINAVMYSSDRKPMSIKSAVNFLREHNIFEDSISS